MTPSPTHDSEDMSFEDKVARIIGTAILKNDKNYTDDMLALIESRYEGYLKPEEVEAKVAEAEQRGMRKVLGLKKARPCPACNDISLIPNDDIGTICVKCKATYPF